MTKRFITAVWLALLWANLSFSQVAQKNRFEILGTVIAETAASKISMPFGDNGVTLSATGEIDRVKLQEELGKEGRSVEEGQVVSVTAISFDDDKIEIELDGGGKNKRGFLDRLEVGVGGRTSPVRQTDTANAKGSRIVLRFEDKAPADLTPDRLKELLAPVLDFNKRNFMTTGIESLPEEMQEAVKAKKARIGMDRSTVLLAKGRPDKKVYETVEGVPREDWIYFNRGMRADFITFEDGVVIRIKRY
jgi:hypothetical protein